MLAPLLEPQRGWAALTLVSNHSDSEDGHGTLPLQTPPVQQDWRDSRSHPDPRDRWRPVCMEHCFTNVPRYGYGFELVPGNDSSSLLPVEPPSFMEIRKPGTTSD